MAEFIVFLGPPTLNELLEDWSSPGPVAFERFVDGPKQHEVPALVPSKPVAALPTITQGRPTSRPSIASQTSTQSLTPSVLVEGSYNDGPTIQPPNFRFDVDQLVPLSKCKTILQVSDGPDLKVTINVLGRVDSIGPLQTLTSTRTGEPLKLLKFVVSDDSTCRTGIGSLQVLAWGIKAESTARILRKKDIVYISQLLLKWANTPRGQPQEQQVEASMGDYSSLQVCCRLDPASPSQGYSVEELRAVSELCEHRPTERVLELCQPFRA